MTRRHADPSGADSLGADPSGADSLGADPSGADSLGADPSGELQRAGVDVDGVDVDAPALLPLEDSIDLHGFQPRDIPSVVEEYTRAAAAQGFREVRLIHGRGTGFQRQRVRQVLSSCAWVVRFDDAPPTRGGWGATLAWLRELREGE